MIKAYKLYTGADGHSHIEEGMLNEEQFTHVDRLSFRESEPQSFYDWHTAPKEQYVLTLTGTLEFTTFINETFILKPGEVLLALDTTGTGHKWRLIDNEPWKRAYVAFTKEAQVNFISLS